jgi:hypothetical protein
MGLMIAVCFLNHVSNISMPDRPHTQQQQQVQIQQSRRVCLTDMLKLILGSPGNAVNVADCSIR